MIFLKKGTPKLYSWLVIDATLTSDNPSKKSLKKKIKSNYGNQKIEIENYNMIMTEKQKKS